jgi:hypothetical protein
MSRAGHGNLQGRVYDSMDFWSTFISEGGFRHTANTHGQVARLPLRLLDGMKGLWARCIFDAFCLYGVCWGLVCMHLHGAGERALFVVVCDGRGQRDRHLFCERRCMRSAHETTACEEDTSPPSADAELDVDPALRNGRWGGEG